MEQGSQSVLESLRVNKSGYWECILEYQNLSETSK